VAAPKSIAIPPTAGPRRNKRGTTSARPAEPDHDEAAGGPPQAQRRTPPRSTRGQPAHRYHVGERLRMGGGGNVLARSAAYCKVIALLPFEGHGPLLYRVRSETEQFERIVPEVDLGRS
jgi:hypothetical protein